MKKIQSRPGLNNFYNGLQPEVKAFFGEIPNLVFTHSFDIILAYVFFRLEQGQRQTLYCGARKLHKTDSDLTKTAIDGFDMTRAGFKKMYENIFGFSVNKKAQVHILRAEEVRDKLLHGKAVHDRDKRDAIAIVLQYAELINSDISGKHRLGFKPFASDLRGFTGRLGVQDKSTSRWILRGMGFNHI